MDASANTSVNTDVLILCSLSLLIVLGRHFPSESPALFGIHSLINKEMVSGSIAAL